MSIKHVLIQNAFWFFDFIKKQPIKKSLKSISIINHKPKSKLSVQTKTKYLENILNHAVSTTSFYESFKLYDTLQDFPIINKNIIRDSFKEFCSSKYSSKNTIKVSTSGSTGSPFTVLHDKKKRNRNTADTLYFAEKAGYEFGQKLIYIKIWPDRISFKKLIILKLKNIYPQSVFRLDDNDILLLIKKINASNEKVSLIGYSSAFNSICKYIDTAKVKPKNDAVVSIITISESLNEYTRSSLKKYFGVVPISRYSNNENGIIAQQEKNQNNFFIINESSYFIEILDLNDDKSVPKGVLGRIVITDYHNYAMPLIRYDTGDVGVLGVNDKGSQVLKSVEGRILDLIYDTNGNRVPSHISAKLCNYGEYKQFQLIQSGEKDYKIKLNSIHKIDETKMLKEFKGYFGEDANILIEYVNQIPLLASGKRREVLNLYYNQKQ